MTHEEILQIFKEHTFYDIDNIEEYFRELGFRCTVDCCQWDDVSYIFKAPNTDAYFYISVDPFMFLFNIFIFKNEDELYCTIPHNLIAQKGKTTYEDDR